MMPLQSAITARQLCLQQTNIVNESKVMQPAVLASLPLTTVQCCAVFQVCRFAWNKQL